MLLFSVLNWVWIRVGLSAPLTDGPHVLFCCSFEKNPKRMRSRSYFLFHFILCIRFSLLFSFPPSRNSDPGSHSRLFSPLPTSVRALHFYPEKTLALSSLVDSRRIVLTHARRSQQLILFHFCKQIQNLATNSWTNTRSNWGLPLVHRGDRLWVKKHRFFFVWYGDHKRQETTYKLRLSVCTLY